MSVTVLYRIRGGEVLKISPVGQPFDDRDTVRFGVLTDPPRPDGDDVRDLTLADPGPLRVLGFAKIWDGTDVRNATQGEINQFARDEEEDEKDQDAEDAAALIDTHPRFRKAFAAVTDLLVDELNELRLLSGLPPRTKGTMIADLKGRVNRDD